MVKHQQKSSADVSHTHHHSQDADLLSQELETEQNHVNHAYTCLDKERNEALQRLQTVWADNHSNLPQHRSERDAFAAHWANKVSRFSRVEDRLVFGRADLEDGTYFHIGRVGLSNHERKQILVDWRAPAARDFYQATAANSNGLVRRRHISTLHRKVTHIEDEYLKTPKNNSQLVFTGEGSLMAALSSARDSRMSDIVSTIQKEQDEIIRANSRGVLVVQGGPGTGKTAVALHRAAYLLYQERERLEKSGALIVGPSKRFLQYISNVLPSLGETNIVSLTPGELLPGIQTIKENSPVVAEIKGRIVWKKILARAVQSLQKLPDSDVLLIVQGVFIKLSRKDYKFAQKSAQRNEGTYNQNWEIFAHTILDLIAEKYAESKRAEITEHNSWIYEDLRETPSVRREINRYWLPTSAKDILDRIYSHPDYLQSLAPEISTSEIQKLFHEYQKQKQAWTISDIPLLDELEEILGPVIARRISSPDLNTQNPNSSQLHDNHASSKNSSDQTSDSHMEETGYLDDLSIPSSNREKLDLTPGTDTYHAYHAIENLGIAGQINPHMLLSALEHSGSLLTTAEMAASDRNWAYGHVVIDEAQEISPMTWRLLARRCPSRSMTIVGDLDQRRLGAPSGGWKELLGNLSENLSETVLSISYRTPKAILQRANAVLVEAGKSPAHPVNPARDLPDAYKLCFYKDKDLTKALHETLISQIEFLRLLHGRNIGTIAVICPNEIFSATQITVREFIINPNHTDLLRKIDQTDLDSIPKHSEFIPEAPYCDPNRVTVIDCANAKGLEFDVVILVHPEQILLQGVGDLYVAMTRPTQRLVVLHNAELPRGMKPQ